MLKHRRIFGTVNPVLTLGTLGLFIVFTFSSCEKTEDLIIDDNESFSNTGISGIKIENYVNRLFIDLIGREPTNEEQVQEAEILNDNELSEASRLDLINRLMKDTTFRVNEGSYQEAYSLNLYLLAKIRCLEGITDQIIRSDFLSNFKGNAFRDSLNGDWESYYKNINEIRRCEYLLRTPEQLRTGAIKYHETFAFLIDNPVYDEFNMNTFNFIRASFDQLLFRLPTEEEYSQAFNMVEGQQLNALLGQSGNSKADYIDILIHSAAMKEGMIRWAFLTFLLREGTPSEVASLLEDYKEHNDINQIIAKIVVTDAYANFF